MSYQFSSQKFTQRENKVFQEYFLADFESQKFLLVNKDINSGQTEVYEANWEREKVSNQPIAIANILGKVEPLETILKEIDVKVEKSPKEAKLVTHSPPFHGDDLMACTLMGKYYESKGIPYSITLTRDQKIIDSADAVVDVGGQYNEENLRFDHHQIKESNKAATGLVADFLQKERGFSWVKQLMPSIVKIDNADLGTPRSPKDFCVSESLSNFNPTWKEKQNNQFFEALEIVANSLNQAIKVTESNPSKSLSEIFEESLLNDPKIKQREREVEEAKIEGNTKFTLAAIDGQNTGIAETKQGIDFYLLFTQEYLDIAPKGDSEALKAINYITFETPTGAINAIAAPKPENRMEQKHPFPQDWRGKRGQELVDAIALTTGENFPPVPQEKANEYFCHNAGFFLTAPDKTLFDKAIDYCANKAKEKSSPNKDIRTADKWGRGGIMGDI